METEKLVSLKKSLTEIVMSFGLDVDYTTIADSILNSDGSPADEKIVFKVYTK